MCCRLTFQSNTKHDDNINQSNLKKSCSYKWKDSCENTFIESFSRLFQQFNSNLTAGNSIEKIGDLNLLYKQAGISMKRRSGPIQVNYTQPDWWDDECLRAKRAKYKYLRRFRASNLQSDFDLYTSHKRQFKTLCTIKKRSLEKKRRQDLVKSCHNPKLFWQTITGLSNKHIN